MTSPWERWKTEKNPPLQAKDIIKEVPEVTRKVPGQGHFLFKLQGTLQHPFLYYYCHL